LGIARLSASELLLYVNEGVLYGRPPSVNRTSSS